MSTTEVHEIPFRDGYTWARVTRPATQNEDAFPLIVLHGGPGMAHNYLNNLAELADQTGRAVIHYDQFGCGNSTHRPDAPVTFWCPQLFVDEFFNLVEHLHIANYHVLGQSWGGMLGAEIAVRRPAGLRSLVISNSPAAMTLWLEGADSLRATLPQDVQDILVKHEKAGTTHDPEYIRAVEVYNSRFVHRTPSVPADYRESEVQEEADPTVYETMNGPNEFYVVGTLRTWDIRADLPKIDCPTLVVSADHDEATPETWQPYLDMIPDARSRVFENGSHCTHLEHPVEYRSAVAEFLGPNDRQKLQG